RREDERVVRNEAGDLARDSSRRSGDDQRAAIAVIGEVKAILRILAEELQRGRARSAAQGEPAEGVVEAGMHRVEVEAAQIDLVGARKRAVAAKADKLAAERRGAIERQSLSVERGLRNLRYLSGRGRRAGGDADGAVAVEILMEGGLERFKGRAVARKKA